MVPCRHPALVHGDFHPNNILLREDGSAVVIDWAGLQKGVFEDGREATLTDVQIYPRTKKVSFHVAKGIVSCPGSISHSSRLCKNSLCSSTGQ